MMTAIATCVDDDFGAGVFEDSADEVECHFCRATVADVDTAVVADWIPSFFDGDDRDIREDHVDSPVCPACQSKHLRLASDGEMELKPRATATEEFSRVE